MPNINKNKVWILDGGGLDHSKELHIYETNNIEYLVSTDKTMDQDLATFGKFANALVVEASIFINERIIQQLSNCKLICSFGIGYNHIDVQAAKEQDIFVCNLPDYCGEEVADHTLALILTLLRRLPTYNKDVKYGKWDSISHKPIHRFKNTTVGLLGFGQIAQKVAQRLKSFGFTILVYDLYVEQKIVDSFNVVSVSLEELLQKSNVLSLHIPLTKETKNLLDEKNMRKLPRDAFIVNTCRGGIIDEDVLVHLIKEGHLSGAGFDVFLSEPPNIDHELFSLDDVIVTPHAAYYSIESVEEMQLKTAENVLRVMNNEQPYNIVS